MAHRVRGWESISKYIGVNLDIGRFYAAGHDPVDYIQKHHARITNIQLKDRNKNEEGKRGANLPWGEASTPIKDVLLLMRKEKYPSRSTSRWSTTFLQAPTPWPKSPNATSTRRRSSSLSRA